MGDSKWSKPVPSAQNPGQILLAVGRRLGALVIVSNFAQAHAHVKQRKALIRPSYVTLALLFLFVLFCGVCFDPLTTGLGVVLSQMTCR